MLGSAEDAGEHTTVAYSSLRDESVCDVLLTRRRRIALNVQTREGMAR